MQKFGEDQAKPLAERNSTWSDIDSPFLCSNFQLFKVFLNDTMANIFASSVELAMDNCQKAFAWEKWNCPSNFFLLKRNSNEIDREQAFVNALLRASFIYTLAKNCSQENRDLAQPHCNVLNEIQDAENANSSSKDPLAYANFHNARAGGIVSPSSSFFLSYQLITALLFQAIKNSLKKLCRCHGVSGSCAIQTCWTSINAFHEITSDIKRMYDNSVLLRLNNAGNVITKNISEEQLVYLEGEKRGLNEITRIAALIKLYL